MKGLDLDPINILPKDRIWVFHGRCKCFMKLCSLCDEILVKLPIFVKKKTANKIPFLGTFQLKSVKIMLFLFYGTMFIHVSVGNTFMGSKLNPFKVTFTLGPPSPVLGSIFPNGLY